MTNFYVRFLIVAALSSTLAWIAMKYLIARYHQSHVKMRSLDLLVAVILASSACGFVGIVLIDATQYSNSEILYWVVPIAVGFVFGVIGCQQVLMSTTSKEEGRKK